MAMLICEGFFIGGFLGAKFTHGISNAMSERVFGIAMLIVSAKMLLAK